MINLRKKLSFSILLQFCLIGLYTPIISTYLKSYLNFSSKEAGLIISMTVIASITAPLIGIFIVDKAIKRKNMLILCYLLSSIFMGLLYFQKTFWPFILLYTIVISLHFISQGLLNAIIFDSLATNGTNFGKIRLWGTVGWVAIGLLISYVLLKSNGVKGLSSLFIWGSILSIMNLIFTIFLPDSHIKTRHSQSIKSNLLKHITTNGPLLNSLLTFYFGVILSSYYYFGASPYLLSLGIDETLILPIIFTAQISEVIILSKLKPIINKIDYKAVLILGTLSHLAGFSLLSMQIMSYPLLAISFLLHGFGFGLYLPGAQILVNNNSADKLKSQIQQVIAVLIGIGSFTGSNIAGSFMDMVTTADKVNYFRFWILPATLSLIIISFLLLTRFKRKSSPNQ